mmetsp:Transcript_3157/g.7758  ORF Transcript_3157/g.7758 Transcript_3157/m.7758 type:complete len:206 (+) Transcript_3157:1037-1654(+)
MITFASPPRPRATSHAGDSSTRGTPHKAISGGTAAKNVSQRQPSGSRPRPAPTSSRRQCVAATVSATDPNVQKLHSAHNTSPRSRDGTDSANRSKGTVNPPMPMPTPKRKTRSWVKFAAAAENKPKTETNATPRMNAGRRPWVSANRPKRAHPNTSPMNTDAATVSSSTSFKCQSLVTSTLRNDSKFTSMLSAATHNPTKKNRRH